MNADLWQGKLVRLAPIDPESYASAGSRWARQSDYWRLMAAEPPMLFSARAVKKWLEKLLEGSSSHTFNIRTLDGDRLIGDIGLDGIHWIHGDSFVGISIGEKDCWGKGYGTDAMQVMLRYAFTELNLHRVSLTVFDYNPRAIRSYEKAGFVHEGRIRQFLNKEGRRYDMLFMGVLREDWLRANLT